MEDLVEKAKFAANEIVRIHDAIQESRDAWKKLDIWDVLSDVPHPKGKGKLVCGREAHFALCDIIKGYRNLKYKHLMIDIDPLIVPFKKEFSQHLLSGELEINEKNLSRMLHRVFQKAFDNMVAKTHFFPCRLYIPNGNESIKIGPVEFKPASQFLDEYKEKRDSSVEQNVQDVLLKWKRLKKKGNSSVSSSHDEAFQQINMLEEDHLEEFEKAEWVAASVVAPCSDKISREIALKNVETAIAIIKLAFGAEFSQAFEVGTPPSRVKTPMLTQTNGKYSYEIAIKWNSIYAPKHFNEVIHDTKVRFLFDQVACLLRARSNLDKLDKLSLKLIHSLNKFGEAVHDISPEYSILNYVIATETVLLPTKRDTKDIVKTYALRAAALAAEKEKDFHELYALFTKGYSARSAIAHGSIDVEKLVQDIPIHKLGRASAFVIYRVIDWLQDPCLPCQPETLEELEEKLSYILTQSPVCDLV